jgi:NitT/TauT family transport system permease protein
MMGHARNGRDALIRAIPAILFFIALITLWQLAVSNEWVSALILPGPWEVVTAFWDLVTGDLIWSNFWATTWETVAGFILGSIIGIVLAVAASMSQILRQMIYPYVVALQVTPRIALAPLIIAWAGFGYTPKIILAITLVFFPVFINALTGMVAADRDAVEMFRSMGASRWQTFVHLRLPSALPVTFAGLKTGMTLALIGAIVGEFIAADKGLGLLLQQFSYQVAIDSAMGVLLVLTIMGFVLYLFMELLDRALVFWSHDSRMAVRTRRRVSRFTRQQSRIDRAAADGSPAAR